jgi:hypothetical protein
MEVHESNRMMSGKGSPRDTLFGVIGKTKFDPFTRSLGGLMITTTKGASPVDAAEKNSSIKKNSEYHIIGAAPKTHVAKQHYGQMLYPGKFMAHAGPEMS